MFVLISSFLSPFRRFQKWQEENPGLPVTQKVVATLLRKVWNKVNEEDIAGKFTANGIYPLNAYAITQDKLLTGAFNVLLPSSLNFVHFKNKTYPVNKLNNVT